MIRKIQTEEERERIQKRNIRFMSVILAVILLFSTAGYFVFDFTDKSNLKEINYRDVKFKQTDYGSWKFSISGYDFETKYFPTDLENISLSTSKILSDYNGKVLYISGEPMADVSSAFLQEITRLLSPFITRINYACLSSNCEKDYAIKNCSADNIIIFKKTEKNSSRITDLEKCAVVEYSTGDEEKAADAFFYRIIGLQ